MRSLLFVLLLAASSASLQAADPAAFAVSTFESLGLYYNRPEARTPCTVSYRVAGSTEWRLGISARSKQAYASGAKWRRDFREHRGSCGSRVGMTQLGSVSD